MSTTKAKQADAVSRLVREAVARVDAIAPAALRAVLPFLKAARDELQTELQAILEGASPDEKFTTYQRTLALRGLEATFDRIEELDPAMAKALGIGRHAVGGIAASTLDDEVRRLSAIFGDGVPHIPQLDQAAIIAQGDRLLWKRHTTSAARYAGSVGDDIKAQFAIGIAKGETFGQLAQRMRKLDPSVRAAAGWAPADDANAIADGMFHRWRHWADRVIRTENMHAYNTQHDLAIAALDEERDEDEEPWLRRWDASADKVTCERCKELDRTVAAVGGEFKWGYKCPPAHPYCRCTIIAWRASWGDMKGEVPSKDAEGKDIAPKPHETKRKPDELPQEGKPKRERKADTGTTTITQGEWEERSGERPRQLVIRGSHGVSDAKGAAGGFANIVDYGEGYASGPYPRPGRYQVTTGSLRDGKRHQAVSGVGSFNTAEEAIKAARDALERQGKAVRRKLGKQAPAEPKAPKVKPPTPAQLEAKNHSETISAVARGEWSNARQYSDEAFRARGYAPHHTTTTSAETKVVPNLVQDTNAAGLHYLATGKIEIDNIEASRAEWFAREWNKDPAAARADIAKFQRERAEYEAGKRTSFDDNQRGAHLWRMGRSQKVLVHESLHGFGATATGEYYGVGGKLEEITTEIMARRTMREQYGLDYTAVFDKSDKRKAHPKRGGAYEAEIQQAIKGIRTATGVTHERALALLEEASDDFKKQPPDGKLHAHERIAEYVAKRVKPKHPDMNTPAPYAQWRDGKIPTRHEAKLEAELWRALH